MISTVKRLGILGNNYLELASITGKSLQLRVGDELYLHIPGFLLTFVSCSYSIHDNTFELHYLPYSPDFCLFRTLKLKTKTYFA